jgi:ParB family chromosome partitioning protein
MNQGLVTRPDPDPINPHHQKEKALMTTQELELINIPLKKLVEWNGNVRQTSADDLRIPELAASIAAVGLLQNLVVAKAPRGQYAVVAGRRRLLALTQLAEAGDYKWTAPIPCHLAAPDADRTELSLAENVFQLPMHPAQQFDAWRSLVEGGRSVADIARFGVSEAQVQQRLALARVSPARFQLYREDKMNLETLRAFCVTDDHAAQEAAWKQIRDWDNQPAATVRRLLCGKEIPAHDKRVRFVGLSEYEADAGLIRQDLFAEGEDGTYILDAAKLDRLATEKLERLAEQAKAEGWKWVAIQPDSNDESIQRLRRLQPECTPLPEKLQKKIQALEAKRDKLQHKAQEEGDDDDESSQTLWKEVEAIEDKISDLEATAPERYSDATKAQTGLVVSIGRNGEPHYTRGLLARR